MEWIANVVAWFEARPALVAWLVGWLAAISAGQIAKTQAPSDLSVDAVKRLTQAVSVAMGAVVAFAVWPKLYANRLAFALVVGMSAPLAYSWLLAAIKWKWPGLAERASVSGVMARKAAAAATTKET